MNYQLLNTLMVLILDGNAEIGAHVRGNPCYLICVGIRLNREKAQLGFFSSPRRFIFLHACVTCSELPSNINTMAGAKFYFAKGFTFMVAKVFISRFYRNASASFISNRDEDPTFFSWIRIRLS